ncbi:diguanylate cyclase domain-containing protein [Actinoplanes subtropicus]|uniref:diguanylate cyclase domain-containing protein n=1 Tax=Actinoplanes subtropicus TaxID=543632 RepID=UPI000AC56260|nr:diguanylate cyclase [Actinoplanes subtropicus]
MGVGLSVLLLTAIGTVGIFVNGSALRAADAVHRSDSRVLGANNAALTGGLQLLSARELDEFARTARFDLRSQDLSDRSALRRLSGSSDFFQYGAELIRPDGTLLTASRDDGLPSAGDPGWAPMRRQVLAGQPGFSAVLTSGGKLLSAVAVPLGVDGRLAGALVGFTELAASQLQVYTARLRVPGEVTSVVDGNGRIAASTDPGRLGSSVDPAIAAVLGTARANGFVEYHSGGTDMIAVVVGGTPSNWAYVRFQTKDSFDGPVVGRNRTTNLTLLAMLLLGVVVVTLLGYRIQVQRRHAEQRFQTLFQHAPDLVAVLDENGYAVYASPSAGALLGTDVRLLLGNCVFDLVHSEDRARLKAEFQELRSHANQVLRRQCRVLAADRTFRWVEFTASNQLHNPSLNGVVINARDVTDSRALQDRLAHEAQHDPLTALPNRRCMNEKLRELLRDQAVGVLFIDLDGFKPINDTYGHEAGDDLLRQVAERLVGHLRSQDLLARVGGDEFVVLMPGMVRYFEAQAFAGRLRRAIEEPFPIGSDAVRISASIGVHLATPADNPDHVLRAADHAMYTIKKAGGGHSASVPQLAASSPAGRHRSTS